MSEWRAMPRTFALAILLALLVPTTAAAASTATAPVSVEVSKELGHLVLPD